MKILGFAATYSPETNEITNKHNYFMNGIIKDDISENSYADACGITQNRSLYAVADGSKSVGNGENVSYLCMDMLGEFIGSDFDAEQRSYFDSANEIVLGRSFEENGVDMSVDMAVLYISGNWAKVYNVGNVSVFYQNDGVLKEISGDMPEKVEVEEILTEDKELKIEKSFKKNVPYIGYISSDSVVAPYVSEKIKLEKNNVFVIATDSVMEQVSESDIITVLNDDNIPDDEKTLAIINLAVEKNPEGNYTVEVIKGGKPKQVANIRVRLIALVLVAILGIAGIFAFPHLQKASGSMMRDFTEFLVRLMYGDIDNKKNITVEPWVPIVDEDEKEKPESEKGEVENEEKPENIQKPVNPQYKPNNPSPNSAVNQNGNGGTSKPNTPVKQEKPVEPPPPIEDNDVELPIDFD